MVENSIELKSLNLNELNGVISLYPWYGGARVELCRRMSGLGEGAWSDESYADAALFVSSRSIVAALASSGKKLDFADSDVSKLLRSYVDDTPAQERRVIVWVGIISQKINTKRCRKTPTAYFLTLPDRRGRKGMWKF